MSLSKLKSDAVCLSSSALAEFDVAKCIICQKNTGEKLNSTENGRKRIKSAADARNDSVTRRIIHLNAHKFYYHVSNNCYKWYIHAKTLSIIRKQNDLSSQNKSKTDDEGIPSLPSTSTQSRQSARTHRSRVPSSIRENVDMRKTVCVICGQIKKDGTFIKFRISESGMAKQFLKATCEIQNEVFTRTCDLGDENSVFGADLYYHKLCWNKFKRLSERPKNPENLGKQNDIGKRNILWAEVEREIRPELNIGTGFPLTSITDNFNKRLIANNLSKCSNKQVKVLLINSFHEEISFSYPKQKNKSLLVIGTGTKREEMADILRSTDIMYESGKKFRDALKTVDFKLQDKFCDSNDLKHSWENIDIPDDILKFFSGVFGFNKNSYSECAKKLLHKDFEDEEEEDDEEDTNDAKDEQKFCDYNALSVHRCRQIQAIFQTFYYAVHNGRKKTPLHVMLGETVLSTCKSKGLVTILNRFAYCISYDELRRYHTDIANFAIQSSKEQVPLPSHFDPDQLTVGAFDNFDHEEATLSGIGGSHDTVQVLIQPAKSGSNKSKPNISVSGINHGDKTLKTNLPCQNLQQFFKPAIKPDIPTDITIEDELLKVDDTEKKSENNKDFLWFLSRMDLENGQINWEQSKQPIPSWSGTNSVWTYENLPEMQVGFMPVVPHPVTEYSTVYTSLKNFQSVLSQLKQEKMAIFCDEGVYRIAKEIQMLRPAEFSNLVIALGSFHMIKVVLSCIGKYLSGSGAESIWVESKSFGLNVVDSVLSGKNYSRSVKGIMQLGEALTRLQLTEFFKKHDTEEYKSLFEIVNKLKALTVSNEREQCRELIRSEHMDSFMKDFDSYVQEQRNVDENFKYWDNFLVLLYSPLRSLIRADREGNWPLHIETVQTLLPIFGAFDASNYFRWCSLYLEDMRNLSNASPDIHEYFMHGGFVVKRTPGHFKAIGVDMCLEQTINKSQKSASGIIGATQKKKFIAEWELIYHEMLAVTNLTREISGLQNDYELSVNHEFSSTETKVGERNIQAMIKFIIEQGNPFASGTELRLHNIVTKELMSNTIRNQLLSFDTIGLDKYSTFRETRFINRTQKLFDTVHRTNLQTFKDIKHEEQKRKSDGSKVMNKKELAHAQRILEVARVRDYKMDFLLNFDIVHSSYLFEPGLIMTKPTKSELIIELEKSLKKSEYKIPSKWEPLSSAVMVDVMANIRKVSTKNLTLFSQLVKEFLTTTTRALKDQKRIDFVFDSYFEQSIKESERSRRTTGPVIELASIDKNRPIAADMRTFWPSSQNKLKLQMYIKEYIKGDTMRESCKLNGDVKIVTSQIVGQSACECDGVELDSLNYDAIEEADMRLVPHILDAVFDGLKRVLVLSPDTDVIVLMLHYWVKFKTHGLEELWVKAGLMDSTRYIPIHILAENIGIKLCNVLPAVHCLTGCDYTSKFGTKKSALKANPTDFLQKFGKMPNSVYQDNACDLAEKYLVQTLKQGSECSTMNEYRSFMHHHRKGITLADLPPTSSSIKQHILRAFYVTYLMRTIVDKDAYELNPIEYGYELSEDVLVPKAGLNLLPEQYGTCCNCGKCARVSCNCRKLQIPCCSYCNCQAGSGSECRNTHGIL